MAHPTIRKIDMNDMLDGWGRYKRSFRDMCPEAKRAIYLVLACTLLYLVSTVLDVAVNDAGPVPRALEIVLALIPGVPLTVGVLAMTRFYRFGDELQKRVMADGSMFGLALTAIVAFPFGILEAIGVLPVPFATDFWVIPVFGWSIGMSFAWKRLTGSALGIPSES
jgi:hypothetical protein